MIYYKKFNYHGLYPEILLPGFTRFVSNTVSSSRVIPMLFVSCKSYPDVTSKWSNERPINDVCRWRKIGTSDRCSCMSENWLDSGKMTEGKCLGESRMAGDSSLGEAASPIKTCWTRTWKKCQDSMCGGGSHDRHCCGDGYCCPESCMCCKVVNGNNVCDWACCQDH